MEKPNGVGLTQPVEQLYLSVMEDGLARYFTRRLSIDCGKAWDTDLNPLLTSPDLRGRNRNEHVRSIFSPKRATLAWSKVGEIQRGLRSVSRTFCRTVKIQFITIEI